MRRGYHQLPGLTSMILLWVIFTLSVEQASAQSPWDRLAGKPSTLQLEQGYLEFKTPEFRIKLVKSSQTIASLSPLVATDFDFTPGELLQKRSADGLYHLGDLNLTLKLGNEWKHFSTAQKRAAIRELPASGNILAAADLKNTFSAEMPLSVTRSWEVIDDKLILRFQIQNPTATPVEIGSLGIPMIFNNILADKSLDEAHVSNVFYDPYIGKDAGYLQVTRLHGHGPVLLVLPDKGTSFEAYNPLLNDPTPRGIVFEGFHEWMVHSKAHAETEWKQAEPWNVPTSFVLAPGDTREYSLQFVLADSIRGIENKLVERKRPVAVGIPGYVVPQDVTAKLFIHYSQEIREIDVYPKGALSIKNSGNTTKNGWHEYHVNGLAWGRSRVSITYADGQVQTVHYKVIKPERNVIEDHGRFLTTEQWYENQNDLFERSPSVITYDYETKQKVTQDSRVWIAGLSDEGGAGSWLSAIMKQAVLPDAGEVAKLERFVQETLWGGLQYNTGDKKYGVKKSMYYYEPTKMPAGTYSDSVNYKTWAAWTKEKSDVTDRSYNYPHVAAAHWVLYRLARYQPGLVKSNGWKWYLENAYYTSMAMMEQAPHYAQYGQMEGTVFLLILQDLKREGLLPWATSLEAKMKERADVWKSLQYPFGSEMPWDSTGQEEVYLWSLYFGYHDKAAVTLNAILAYMPTVAHWGYNGSARRYWDFLYGGKLSRVERQLHHYGSGLNAIPVLTEYRRKPDDLYLLRVGYGGLMGSIANITQDGFGPAAFHSFPSTLRIDALSGDYGPNFFGYAVNTATYLTHDTEFGWLTFGGNSTVAGEWVHILPSTASRSRLFIAPLSLWLTLDAGQFEKVSVNTATGQLKITFAAADKYAKTASLKIEIPESKEVHYKPTAKLKIVREAYVISLKGKPTEVIFNTVPKK